MLIIMRNTTTRKDAVYILHTRNGFTELVAHWGRWSVYKKSGLADLSLAVKATGTMKVSLKLKALLGEKQAKGYVVCEVHDLETPALGMLEMWVTAPWSSITFTGTPTPELQLPPNYHSKFDEPWNHPKPTPAPVPPAELFPEPAEPEPILIDAQDVPWIKIEGNLSESAKKEAKSLLAFFGAEPEPTPEPEPDPPPTPAPKPAPKSGRSRAAFLEF